MLASELYANSQGAVCEGDQECHWCAGKCSRRWRHDDRPLPHFVKTDPNRPPSKRPNNTWVCMGCWLWRRPSVTVESLTKVYYRDRQSPRDHSWFVTPDLASAVKYRHPEEAAALYLKLLSPPLKFSLSLLDGDGEKNHLQLQVVNCLAEVKGDTPLLLTVNNTVHTYTVFQLEEGLQTGEGAGLDSGVREVLRLLGRPQQAEEVLRGRGRPAGEEGNLKRSRRVVKSAMSGHQ